MKAHFIVIDDSRLDCFIAEKVIKNAGTDLKVTSYSDARQALEFIETHAAANSEEIKTVLIVDIQMPLMNGFEFIEAFEQLPENIRERFWVYVLTSSTNQNDLNRMKSYQCVRQVLNKPLSTQSFLPLLEDIF